MTELGAARKMSENDKTELKGTIQTRMEAVEQVGNGVNFSALPNL